MSERQDYELGGGTQEPFDDVELRRLRLYGVDEEALGRPRRRSAGPGILVLLALAAGVGAYLFWVRRAELGRAPAAPAVTRPMRPAPGAVAPADTRPLPALAASDAFVRELVGALSRHPQLASWLATDELVRRFVAGVASFAEGNSPGPHVPLLRPAEGFSASSGADRLVVDPASYERYDLLAEAVDSLDVAGTAELYRRLEPLFDEAYRDLGFPDGRFRDVAVPAIDRLLVVSPADAGAELTAGTPGYRFADPRLEGLDAASKHLLRLGPRNLALIQAKVGAVSQAAGLTAAP